MTARSLLRGHPMFFNEEQDCWCYSDNGEPTAETWRNRTCGHCGRETTSAGHDGCLGELPGVKNACCGHGVVADAYVQFDNDEILSGAEAVKFFERNAAVFAYLQRCAKAAKP